MRELLDSERRTSEVRSWYLHPFLDSLIQVTRTILGKKSLSRTNALTRVYRMLGR